MKRAKVTLSEQAYQLVRGLTSQKSSNFEDQLSTNSANEPEEIAEDRTENGHLAAEAPETTSFTHTSTDLSRNSESKYSAEYGAGGIESSQTEEEEAHLAISTRAESASEFLR